MNDKELIHLVKQHGGTVFRHHQNPDNPALALSIDKFKALLAELLADERKAWPQLDCVIAWLENGCDPKDAAKELRLYAEKIRSRGQQ